ncbi:hypothetical protein DPMN_184938 [Dreissena polymorpha]|uniref:Uncharacterized protein n=1 Tax=Dreissena polymorpha TaxID=45954 RepID=A0A9D4I527_DREPO|nr:hypothetical protein DPMN_184938 [Dreissena polymorpha]
MESKLRQHAKPGSGDTAEIWVSFLPQLLLEQGLMFLHLSIGGDHTSQGISQQRDSWEQLLATADNSGRDSIRDAAADGNYPVHGCYVYAGATGHMFL